MNFHSRSGDRQQKASCPSINRTDSNGRVQTEVVMGFSIIGLLLLTILLIGISGPKVSAPGTHSDRLVSAPGPSGEMRLFGELGTEPVDAISVRVSADGRIVLASDRQETVRAWNGETGAESILLQNATSPISGLDIAPDGSNMVMGHSDGTVEVRNRQSQLGTAAFSGHESPIAAVCYYTFGGMVLSADRAGTVCLWTTKDGTLINSFKTDQQVSCMQFSADGTRFIIGAKDGTVQVWKTADMSGAQSQFRSHKDNVAGVALTPNSTQAWSIDAGGMVVRYELRDSSTNIELQPGDPISGPVTAMALSTGGTRMIVANATGQLHLLNMFPQARVAATAEAGAPVNDAVFSPDGQFVYCGCQQKKLQIWQLPMMSLTELESIQSRVAMIQQRGEELRDFSGHLDKANAAVTNEQIEAARTEYVAARGAVPPESLEFHIADQALKKIDIEVAGGERYKTLMQQGKLAANSGDFGKARSRFEEARDVMPGRPEAPAALAKLDEAAALQDMSKDIEIERKIAFEFDGGGQDLLEIGEDYAWIYDREELKKQSEKGNTPLFLFSRIDSPEAPVGLKTSAIGWTAQITAKKPLPSEHLKARLKMVRLADSMTISEKDYPLKLGDRVFQLADSIPSPDGGWAAGDYSFRKYIVQMETDSETGKTVERISEHGTPMQFQIGLIHWEKKESSISPKDVVQQADFKIEHDLTVRSGDAFRVDASGKITPAVVSLYRDLLDSNRAIPNDVGGISFNRSLKTRKYTLVMDYENYGALLCCFDSRDSSNWISFQQAPKRGVAPSTGKLLFSINSVAKTNGSNSRFWLDQGEFKIAVYRGVWNFVDPLNIPAKDALLKSFWK